MKRLSRMPSRREVLERIATDQSVPIEKRTSALPWLILGGIGTAVVVFWRKPGPSGHQNY